MPRSKKFFLKTEVERLEMVQVQSIQSGRHKLEGQIEPMALPVGFYGREFGVLVERHVLDETNVPRDDAQLARITVEH